jgi:hypothetical protein
METAGGLIDQPTAAKQYALHSSNKIKPPQGTTYTYSILEPKFASEISLNVWMESYTSLYIPIV